MKSVELLPRLEALPAVGYGRMSYEEIIQAAGRMHRELFPIEVAVASEAILSQLFEARNVPDVLSRAHEAAFTGVSAHTDLHEHYQAMLERGPDSVVGFVSTMKGKVAELRVCEQLEAQNPGWDFTIADNPTQACWDVIGASPEGQELLIQVKTGSADYAGSVADAMAASPDTMFAVSSEIQEAIAASYPELLDRIVDVQWVDFGLVNDVNEGLGLLAGNFGIDVPDGLADALPFVAEIALGIRVLHELAVVKRDYDCVAVEHRQRIGAVRALVLCGRFGVSSVVISAGAALGGTVDGGSLGTTLGAGSLTGAAVGTYAAWRLKPKIEPHLLDLALTITSLTKDDLFYFRNKGRIDNLGASIQRFATSVA